MDFHIITAAGAELVARKVDGQLVIVPPPAAPQPAPAQAEQAPK